MKKRKLKLGLNKVDVSKLNSVNGGGRNKSNVATCVETVSLNFLDLCCKTFFNGTTSDESPLTGAACDGTSAGLDCTNNGCEGATDNTI
ncbi:hypothetical protein [Kordia sp.]|uniref:hypothetical protein n=1 Tax=Kordia sp. TaxID=1965332 RepID=UPI003B58D86E